MDIFPAHIGYDPYASGCTPPLSYDTIIIITIIASLLGIVWTGYNLLMIRRIDLTETHEQQNQQGLVQDMPQEQRNILLQFGYKVYDASIEFVKYEYFICLMFSLAAFLLLWFVTDLGPSAAIAFIVGVIINLFTGLLSFVISTRSSCRIAYCSKYGLGSTFKTSFQASSIISFSTTSFNLLALAVGVQLLKQQYDLSNSSTEPKYFVQLFEAVAAYGLGVSFVGLFTRLGGSIFEAATQIGSDLLGKVEGSLPFNHSKNAATVSKHAGSNCGGMMGLNNDTIGSYCELTCVTFLLSSNSLIGFQGEGTVCAINLASLSLPLVILSFGIILSLITNIIAGFIIGVQSQQDLIKNLRLQRIIPFVLMIGLLYLSVYLSLPHQFQLIGVNGTYFNIHSIWQVYLCGFIGLFVSFFLFLLSQVSYNQNFPFVGLLVQKCSSGSAASITFGLAFGYLNSIFPIIVYSLAAFFTYNLLGYYGVSIAALTLLSLIPIQISLQSLHFLLSNALTSAEIANMNEQEKDNLKILSSQGSNSLLVNRSISVGCVALLSMTLFGGFLSNSHLDTPEAQSTISLTDPLIFTGLLIGGIFPFVLTGLTVKAARKAIIPLKEQILRQIKEDQAISRGQAQPDYAGSIKPISSHITISLIGPIILVLVAPFVFGLAIGPKIVSGILLGMIVSGLQFSSSITSSSDAWSKAKIMLQSGVFSDDQGKVLDINSESYRSACLGNEVGSLFGKCGSSIGSSIKVMGMLAVLFGPQFASVHS